MMKMQKWCWKIAVSLCGLVLGPAALAVDCAVTAGSVPLTFNAGFRPSYDISALPVGDVIDEITVTTTDSPVTTVCPGAPKNRVSAGFVSGGGLIANQFGALDSVETRVAGVGIRVKGSRNNAWSLFPQSPTGAGPTAATWIITLIKISSANTGNDTLPANASVTVAMGDNRMQVYRYVLSGGIRFNRGSVTTCVPTVMPGNAIRLPSVAASALVLGANANTATPFSIQLNNCQTNGVSSNGVTVRTFFDGPRVNAGTGNLNVTGTATNVQLQLTNGDGSVINLAGARGSQNSTSTQIRAGTASLPYAVRYFATGRAGPGTVSSTVNFTMEFP